MYCVYLLPSTHFPQHINHFVNENPSPPKTRPHLLLWFHTYALSSPLQTRPVEIFSLLMLFYTTESRTQRTIIASNQNQNPLSLNTLYTFVPYWGLPLCKWRLVCIASHLFAFRFNQKRARHEQQNSRFSDTRRIESNSRIGIQNSSQTWIYIRTLSRECDVAWLCVAALIACYCWNQSSALHISES